MNENKDSSDANDMGFFDNSTDSVNDSSIDEEMIEVVKEFLQESYENIDRIDSELMELEEQPDNPELLSSIFRSIHTIKGTCGFFGFVRLEKVAHVGENLLVKLRDGEYRMSSDIANGLLGMVDAIRAMLDEISDKGNDGQNSYDDLIKILSELNETGQLSSTQDLTDESTASAVEETTESIAVGKVESATVSNSDADLTTVAEIEAPAVEAKTQAAVKEPTSAVDASIRVDIPVLDSLMNLVGELVLARNQIVEYVGAHENTHVVAAAQRLNLITSELQEGVMQTRMQPISSVWTKLPRVVRDLSKACGKKIRVEMEGKSTELDKSLIEAMKDPLTHLVRNTVDHGIEMPEERLAAGKPEEGTLLLRAFHEGGQVHIELSDDGGGINPTKVREKALLKGLITEQQAASMSDQDICKMIFLPGFSTAENVTNISGRGVGMDVVKTNIERISGAIDLQTEPGKGTSFKIKVPLTLAIVPALIVSSASQRFAIPQVNLIELIRIEEEDESNSIENIHGCPVYRLRGRLLPLVYLDRELNLQSKHEGALNIVVLQAEKCRFGLVVDSINDTQEIVVKPLAEALKSIPVFAGATIMGDGRVALILDTLGVGQRAKVLSERSEKLLNDIQDEDSSILSETQSLLLARSEGNARLAIPLRQVARLEQIETSKIEHAGTIDVVQYRGQILPLVKLEDVLQERRAVPRESEDIESNADDFFIQVVVFGEEGRQVGLVVKEIIDVVDEVIQLQGKATRTGILGTASIQGYVTELFDAPSFIQNAEHLMVEPSEAA